MTWDTWNDWNCCGHGHHSNKRRHHRDCDGRRHHDCDCKKRNHDHTIVQCFGDNCFEVEHRTKKDCGCNHW
ncbi:MAG TPA: hypothetical protein VNT75_19200 [Symbiobacteriaceae bacterium]|nr:hypothetical protein [Symbiobacteriaceae bacterium]